MPALFIPLLLIISCSCPLAKADLVLTMGGDINLAKDERDPERPLYSSPEILANLSQQPTSVRLAMRAQTVFKKLLTGDLNFGNLETVVSEDRNLQDYNKKFTFMTHPEMIKILTDYGLNLFSTANNHIFDFGEKGAAETLRSLAVLKEEIERKSLVDGNPARSLYYAGLATDIEAATEPVLIEINGMSIAFAAIGFGAVSTGSDEGSIVKNTPGIVALHNKPLVNKLLQNLAHSKANLKILSVHNGKEGVFELDPGQRTLYHDFLKRGDLDLIIGHHPHVVRPIENVNGKLIFYSLGNYFMTGAASRDDKGVRGNYGLFSRLYFEKRTDSNRLHGFRLVTEAAELIPLTHMQANINTKTASEATANLNDLKQLNGDELGDQALAFSLTYPGVGLYCGEQILGPRAQILCSPGR